MKNAYKYFPLWLLLSVAAVLAQTTATEFMHEGNRQILKRDYDAAINNYTECIKLDAKEASCYQNRAAALLEKSKTQPVKLVNPLANMTGGGGVKVDIAGSGSEIKDETRKKALADANKAIELRSKHAGGYYTRARIYDAESIYEKAVADYRQALTLDPNNVRVKGGLAEAEKYYAERLAMSAEALMTSASLAEQTGNKSKAAESYQKSVETFTKILEINKTDVGMFIRRGKAYERLKNYGAAASDYKQALTLNPQHEEAKAALAKLPKDAGANPAIAGSSVTSAPSTSMTAQQFATQGRREANQKDYPGAIKSFSECIRLKPDAQLCYTYRGVVYGLKGDMQAASTDFDKALQIAPNNAPSVLLMRAMMFVQLRRKDDAIADFRAILKIDPNNDEVKQALRQLGVEP